MPNVDPVAFFRARFETPPPVRFKPENPPCDFARPIPLTDHYFAGPWPPRRRTWMDGARDGLTRACAAAAMLLLAPVALVGGTYVPADQGWQPALGVG